MNKQIVFFSAFGCFDATIDLKVREKRWDLMVEERDRCQSDLFEIIEQLSSHSYLIHRCSSLKPWPCLTTQKCSVSRVTAAVLPTLPLSPRCRMCHAVFTTGRSCCDPNRTGQDSWKRMSGLQGCPWRGKEDSMRRLEANNNMLILM